MFRQSEMELSVQQNVDRGHITVTYPCSIIAIGVLEIQIEALITQNNFHRVANTIFLCFSCVLIILDCVLMTKHRNTEYPGKKRELSPNYMKYSTKISITGPQITCKEIE